MPGEHAKLSASGSKRWMECPGSILLEEMYEEEDSEYAAEGTQAHALAEIMLRHQVLKSVMESNVQELWDKADAEMRRYTTEYVEYCKDLYDNMMLKHKDTVAFIEERVRYDEWAEEGYGTVDFCVIGGDEIHIVDLKYGKGVPVSAEGNPQPRLYAKGALQELGFLYDLKKIKMHIVQPRLQSISTEEMTVAELLKWGEDVLIPRAKKAFIGTREYSPGSHCKFCKARATCKARANKVLNSIAAILTKGE